jgi:hypothetical protein
MGGSRRAWSRRSERRVHPISARPDDYSARRDRARNDRLGEPLAPQPDALLEQRRPQLEQHVGHFSSTRRIASRSGTSSATTPRIPPQAPAATLVGVWLAGVALSDDLVVELAQRLQRNGAERTAQALLKAAISGRSTAALGPEDRTNILAVLADPPLPGLEELHGVLLREVRRRRGGL